MNKLVLTSLIFLATPFCFACNETTYDISIVKSEESEGNFTYTTSRPKPVRGADFSIYFKPAKYYDLHDNCFEIFVKNEPVQEGYWTFNDNSKELKIKGEVISGNVKVSVTQEKGQYTYTIKNESDFYIEVNGTSFEKTERAYDIDFEIDNPIEIKSSDANFGLNKIQCDSSYKQYYLESEGVKYFTIPKTEYYRDIVVTIIN